MKILVCGNGPSLIDQLQSRRLSKYDLVVRTNRWKEIHGFDNRCDAWVFYPLHHLGEQESLYDIFPMVEKTHETWITHPWTIPTAVNLLREMPTKVLNELTFQNMLAAFRPNCPNTGTLAIAMAMEQTDEPIDIAGFDFYEGDKLYYYSDSENTGGSAVHDPQKDKAWIYEKIREGRINIL